MIKSGIVTDVISVDEAIKQGNYPYNKTSNDVGFKGIIPGYVLGFCCEVINPETDEIRYTSCTFTNDYEMILLPEDSQGNCTGSWNDLGINCSMCLRSGYIPTGVLVFRGYYSEFYDSYERDYYYHDSSMEALKFIKYKD